MPELDPNSVPPTNWTPTRKWVASVAGSVAAIVASLIQSGQFDELERGMLATAVVSLTASYFTPNTK